MTLYEVLDISPSASAAEIKAAYREAVKAHHPDAGGDPARFIAAQRAYAVLSDPERRARYDRTGVEDEAGAADDKEAYNVLSALVLQAVEGDRDLRRTDVLGDVGSALRRQETAHLAARKAVEHRIARVRLLKSRLRHSGAGEDVLSALLTEREAALEGARTGELDRLRIIGRALELIEAYSYHLDTTNAEEAAIWSALRTPA